MPGVNCIVEIDAGEDGEDIGLQDATSSSSAVSATVRPKGRTAPTSPEPKALSMVTKPAKTFSVMCPARMLANSRTLWETGRDRKESTSMKVTSGRI